MSIWCNEWRCITTQSVLVFVTAGVECNETDIRIWPWALWEGEGWSHHQNGPRVWGGDHRQKLTHTLQSGEVCIYLSTLRSHSYIWTVSTKELGQSLHWKMGKICPISPYFTAFVSEKMFSLSHKNFPDSSIKLSLWSVMLKLKMVWNFIDSISRGRHLYWPM